MILIARLLNQAKHWKEGRITGDKVIKIENLELKHAESQRLGAQSRNPGASSASVFPRPRARECEGGRHCQAKDNAAMGVCRHRLCTICTMNLGSIDPCF